MQRKIRIFSTLAAFALAAATPFAFGYTQTRGQDMNRMDTAPATQAPPIACSATAFTAEERTRWKALSERLLGARTGTRELSDGYAFEFPRGPETLRDVAEFIEFESRCCPFFTFSLQVPAGGKEPVSLHIAGAPGVKEFVKAELGIEP
jgi:hypothetical protein